VNASGERLFEKTYELRGASSAETTELADMILTLVNPQSWDRRDGCCLSPAMTGGTIRVCHTAATHRKIHKLLGELGAYQSGDGADTIRGHVIRFASLSLPARSAENVLADGVVLHIVRLDPRMTITPQELADEIRQTIEPESWKRKDAVYLCPFRRQLVIRQSVAAQRKIYRLLENKDALAKPQLLGFGGVF
jgi:hypothetical protein